MSIYLDPYTGLSRDEVLQKTYADRLTPDLQAKARAIAEERGITVMDLLREMANEYDAAMADPARRDEWLRISEEMNEQDAAPFGKEQDLL